MPMFVKTIDNVISKDLLRLVQEELRWMQYTKHESVVGDGNVFFNSETSGHSTHQILVLCICMNLLEMYGFLRGVHLYVPLRKK